jgi:fumarate reductase subunit D
MTEPASGITSTEPQQPASCSPQSELRRWQSMRRLGHRKNLLWLAALLHRLSGLALALFLPVHFLTLGLALDGEARLDGFLRWTEAPLVKLSEAGLLFLFSVHVLGGLRLLAIENLAWHDRQKWTAAVAVALAAALAVAFLAISP